METLTAIAKRTSVREFTKQPLAREKILSIVDAGRRAPTARGIEPREFVVVQDKTKLTQLGRLCENGKFIKDAGCCIAVFCKDTKYYLEDGCAATENMLLAACDLGIASCWVAGDKKPYCQKIKGILGAAEPLKLVSMIALGYARCDYPAHKKRSITEVLHWEAF